MFIYQYANLFFGHFTEKIVDKFWIVKMFVFIDEINPFFRFQFQVNVQRFWFKLFRGRYVFIKRLFISDHSFQDGFAKKFAQKGLFVGKVAIPQDPFIPIGIVQEHLVDGHLAPLGLFVFIDFFNSIN